jgi:thioredoxin-like negative regulator of GroEL
MIFELLVFANIALAIVLAYIVFRAESLRDFWGFHIGAFAAVLTLVILMLKFARPPGGQVSVAFFIRLMMMCVAGILYVPFILHIIAFYGGQTWDSLSGVSDVKVRKTYSKAEAAEKERNYEEAMGHYKKELEQEPEDAEARRRLAELFYTTGDFDGALKTFRVAYTFEKEQEKRAGIAFRIVDILLAKGEDFTALKELEHIKRAFPNTQYARHATDRVQRLKLAKLRKLKR